MRRDEPADDAQASRLTWSTAIVHYCVTNMPGAVGRTSTYALNNVTLPYVLQLARMGWREMASASPGFAEGINIDRGRVTNQAVPRPSAFPTSPGTADATNSARTAAVA